MKKTLTALLLLNCSLIFSQTLPNLDKLEHSDNVITKNYEQSLALPENRKFENEIINSADIDHELVGFGLQADIFKHVSSHQISTIHNFSTIVDYKLTPGDMFNLTIHSPTMNTASERAITYSLQLQKDYSLELPMVGKINAKGMSIAELRELAIYKIKSAVSIQMATFTLESPAQFNVFINGGVNIPGSFPTSPTRTVIDAISTAGGFKAGASYRQIELQRDGKVIYLDLASYYEKADLTQNPNLQPGDKIHVPIAKKVAMLDGYVKYKGTYELIEEENLRNLILLAGGFKATADINNIEIHRTNFYGNLEVLKVPYSEADNTSLENGDTIFIRSMVENSPRIIVDGAVFGNRQINSAPSASPFEPIRIDIPYYQSASILSVLDKVGGPTPYSRSEESFIKRANSLDIIRIDIKKLWETRDLDLDLELLPGDTLVIPIENLLVFVGGEVNSPKAVRYSNSLKVFDYVMLAGGHTKNANKRKVYEILESGKKVEISVDDYIKPGTAIYVEKNFAELSGEVFQDVMIYTSFITNIFNTITSVVTAVRNVDSLR